MFVEGTHDNLDLLNQYPDEQYCGGKVKRLSKNMLWMQRGEIYDIEGTKIFALGGGESHDADERIAGESYLNLVNSISYMIRMMISIVVIQNFRKRGRR